LEQVSWLTPNETEIRQCLLETSLGSQDAFEIAEVLLKRIKRGVVLKMGARGAFLATKDGIRAQIEAFRVNAVDTTAAGDAFNGAFAVGLMMGKTPVESAEFAAAAGAVSVTRAGAQPSLATMEEVEKLLVQRAN